MFFKGKLNTKVSSIFLCLKSNFYLNSYYHSELLKKRTQKDDLRKRDDLRGFYGTGTLPVQLAVPVLVVGRDHNQNMHRYRNSIDKKVSNTALNNGIYYVRTGTGRYCPTIPVPGTGSH
jgi:hypothetical protein